MNEIWELSHILLIRTLGVFDPSLECLCVQSVSLCRVQPPTACADEGVFSYVPNAAAFGGLLHSSSEIILPDNDIFNMSVKSLFLSLLVIKQL